jgi:hypothetical protein
MAKQNSVNVQFKDGFANITLGDQKISIARRYADTQDYFCPIDLIAASIGS